MPEKIKIRLYVPQELKIAAKIAANEMQYHYLFDVMKCKNGGNILCFDGKNGEFCAKLCLEGKKKLFFEIMQKTADFKQSSDLWILFAPLKKDNTDFVVQKSTELGVQKIVPVITKNTITEKIKKERFEAQCIEAAEQSRRLDVPSVEDAVSFEKMLQNWEPDRTLFFMDETMQGQDAVSVFSGFKGKASILCGPEGGFCESELAALRSKEFARAVSLGPRILRAETAVVAALSCWQAVCGDWRK